MESSTSSKGKAKAKRRPLTESQRAHKRDIDRAKHRSNRAEHKARLDDVEKNVASLRSSISELVQHVRRLTGDPAIGESSSKGEQEESDSVGTQDSSNTSNTSNAWLSAPANAENLNSRSPQQRRLPGGTAQTFEANLSTMIHPQPYAPHSNPFLPYKGTVIHAKSAGSSVLLPSSILPAQLMCRCGHHNEGEASFCTELAALQLLVNNMGTVLPRDLPPWEKLLSPTPQTDNDIAATIMAFSHRLEFQDLPTLLGAAFCVYRLIRWRLHPTAEFYRDVPEALRPTSNQQLLVHPVVIDAMPWPAMRELIITNPTMGEFYDLASYNKSLRFVWPEDEPVVTKHPDGRMTQHPEFERRVCDLRNWKLSGTLTEQFPELLRLTH